MGMTIDDNVDFLNEAKDFFEDVANDPKIKETVKTYFIIESLETAVSTIRKYQKIEQIINNAKDSDGAVKYNWLYEQISEVLEDGHND